MAHATLYHNPGCGTSRGALAILNERNAKFDKVEYLVEPLDRATLERIAKILIGPLEQLVRRDRNFEQLGLDPTDYQTADAVIELLLEHPRLMQRPIFASGDRALVCRPSEKILELL
jgi:arsenate reductase (glutaredoxin)